MEALASWARGTHCADWMPPTLATSSVSGDAVAACGAPDVDAVFCTNDIVAIGVLDAARRSGRQVPSEIWIVGYDDIPMARWECISLSTVQQPLPAMVEQVVDRLQRRMTSPDLAPHTFVMPNDLVLRRTTS